MVDKTSLVAITTTTPANGSNTTPKTIDSNAKNIAGNIYSPAVRNTSLINPSFGVSLYSQRPTFSTGLSINPVPQNRNLLAGQFTVGLTPESGKDSTGATNIAGAYSVGLKSEIPLISEQPSQRHGSGCMARCRRNVETTNINNGLYADVSANKLLYTSTKEQKNYTVTNDLYFGAKYVAGNGKYTVDAGMRRNDFIPGGKNYQAGFTGSFPIKGKNDRFTELYVRAQGSYNPFNKKVEPTVTAGIALH